MTGTLSCLNLLYSIKNWEWGQLAAPSRSTAVGAPLGHERPGKRGMARWLTV